MTVCYFYCSKKVWRTPEGRKIIAHCRMSSTGLAVLVSVLSLPKTRHNPPKTASVCVGAQAVPHRHAFRVPSFLRGAEKAIPRITDVSWVKGIGHLKDDFCTVVTCRSTLNDLFLRFWESCFFFFYLAIFRFHINVYITIGRKTLRELSKKQSTFLPKWADKFYHEGRACTEYRDRYWRYQPWRCPSVL